MKDNVIHHSFGNVEPQDYANEQALIAALIAYDGAFSTVKDFLLPEHFWYEIHNRMYQIMLDYSDGERQFTVTDVLTHMGPDKEDNTQYLIVLNRQVATEISVRNHAKTVFEYWQRRQAMRISNHCIDCACDPESDETGDELISNFALRLNEIPRLNDGFVSVSPEMACKAFLAPKEQKEKSIKTGIRSLDGMLGGLFREEMTILGGRPSMGKTAIGCQVALNAAAKGFGVLFVSLEMPAAALYNRIYTSMSWVRGGGIAYSDIRNDKLSQGQTQRLRDVSISLQNYPLSVIDRRGIDVDELSGIIRLERTKLEDAGHTLDLVICDHLDLFKTDEYGTNKVAQTGHKSNKLRELSKEFNVHMLVLCQLSRELQKRESKAPIMADLKWSGDIEQDADNVVFIHRPYYYLDDWQKSTEEGMKCFHESAFIVAKQRNGAVGDFTLFCDLKSNYFGDEVQ